MSKEKTYLPLGNMDVSASVKPKVCPYLGTYDFTDATDGSKTTVEYTFGYKKNKDGKVFYHALD